MDGKRWPLIILFITLGLSIPCKYLLQYSFIGKEVIYEEVTIPSELGEDFGVKMMKADIIMGEVVAVTAEYVPIQIKQDTVTFNAKAFKTRTGAVVEDLLKKIPGIEVDSPQSHSILVRI